MLVPLKQNNQHQDRTLEACKCLARLKNFPSRIIHAVSQTDYQSGKVLKMLETYAVCGTPELRGYATEILDVTRSSLTAFKPNKKMV
jgi:hypothetical protein